MGIFIGKQRGLGRKSAKLLNFPSWRSYHLVSPIKTIALLGSHGKTRGKNFVVHFSGSLEIP